MKKYKKKTKKVNKLQIKHINGGITTFIFKSYGECSKNFQGIENSIIWPNREKDIIEE